MRSVTYHRSWPRAALAAVALTAVGTVASGATADAQTTPTVPPPPTTTTTTTTLPPPPGASLQLVGVAIELSRTSGRLDQVAAQVAAVQARLADAQAALAAVEQQVTATKAQIDLLQAELTQRAAVVYRQHSDNGAVLRVQHVIDVAAGVQYTSAASADETHQLDQLRAAETQLEHERSQRDAQRQGIADDELRLEALRSNLDAVRARDQALLDQMGAVPLMGRPRLTGPQIAGWFHSTGATAHLAANTTIDQLAQMYVDEGNTVHIAGDAAFAQAVIETGSFGHALDNNFAGIGACDSCTSENAFPTPRDGVRAQVQLLRNYADPDSRAATLGNPPEPGLYGSDPFAAAASFDSFSYKGSAPTWNVMGKGKWATDPDYATKVLDIYARMIAFAATHG